jgi:hypothetical protein
MRRFLLVVVASCAVLVAVPALATAGRSRHDPRAKHHLREHHRRHHARVRHERFGGGSSTTSGDQEDQGNAGTVASFTGGVLRIRLTDGTTVSGEVTADTELKCEMPEQDMQAEDQGSSGGDVQGDVQGEDQGDVQGDVQGEDQGENEQMCTTVSPGMVVRDAELRISSAGNVWDEVELIS